eukprot:939081-Rhodomonas_salina.1
MEGGGGGGREGTDMEADGAEGPSVPGLVLGGPEVEYGGGERLEVRDFLVGHLVVGVVIVVLLLRTPRALRSPQVLCRTTRGRGWPFANTEPRERKMKRHTNRSGAQGVPRVTEYLRTLAEGVEGGQRLLPDAAQHAVYRLLVVVSELRHAVAGGREGLEVDEEGLDLVRLTLCRLQQQLLPRPLLPQRRVNGVEVGVRGEAGVRGLVRGCENSGLGAHSLLRARRECSLRGSSARKGVERIEREARRTWKSWMVRPPRLMLILRPRQPLSHPTTLPNTLPPLRLAVHGSWCSRKP